LESFGSPPTYVLKIKDKGARTKIFLIPYSFKKIPEDEGEDFDMLLNFIFIVYPVLAVCVTVGGIVHCYRSFTSAKPQKYLDGDLWRYQAAYGCFRGMLEYLGLKLQLKYKSEKV